MDMEQFQQDLLESVRQMKAGTTIRTAREEASANVAWNSFFLDTPSTTEDFMTEQSGQMQDKQDVPNQLGSET